MQGKNVMWSTRMKLACVKTISGAEKIMDIDELVAYAKSENDPNLSQYVDTILKYEILQAEEELVKNAGAHEVDEDDLDEMCERISLADDEQIYILEVKKEYKFVKRKTGEDDAY